MSIFDKFKELDRNSNLYTFLYAAGMVVVVAVLLAVAATSLKPIQLKNIETEKKIDILRSIGKAWDLDTVRDKHRVVESLFQRYIVGQPVVDVRGRIIPDIDAFGIDLKVEYSKMPESRHLPLFKARLDDGTMKYIIPVRGKGLWGPIWGYISLDDDFNTIYGATFSHKGETPGLGAEIATPSFQKQFVGKHIFDNRGGFTSIRVVKGGASPSDPHAVDAISGGTITSKKLEEMLKSCLGGYRAYFNHQKELNHE